MEQRFGLNFAAVSVHDDTDAATSAVALGAEAYTVGTDVAFAPGRYQPREAAGRRLIAHELAHVVQQAAGPLRLQRQTSQTTGQVPAAAPGPPAANQLDVDVCEVNAGALTNEALILQLHRVRSYLNPRQRGQDDFYAYANLLRRLVDERRRRMELGHVWLGDELSAMPSELYRMTPGPGPEVVVARVDATPYRGMPDRVAGELVTPHQFQVFLEHKGIRTIDARDYFARQGPEGDPLHVLLPAPPPLWDPRFGFGPLLEPFRGPLDPFEPFSPLQRGLAWPGAINAGMAGGQLYQSPFGVNVHSAAARQLTFNPANPRSRGGAWTNYRGTIAEMSYGRGNVPGIVMQGDLNAIQSNFEVFDWRNRFTGTTTSVTSSVPLPPAATGPRPAGPIQTAPDWGWYEEKLGRAFGQTEQAKFATATNRLNTAYGTTLTPQHVAAGAYLAVNADHVDDFRARLRQNIPQNPARYMQMIDAVLRADPMDVPTGSGTTRVAGWNDLQGARAQMSPADYQTHLSRVADRAALRVVSNGITTEELSRLITLREFTRGMTPQQFRAQVPPELLESIRLGGTGAAAHEAGLRGGAIQGGIGTAFDIARMVGDESAHPYWYAELPSRAALQFGGGYATSAMEASIVAAGNEALLGSTGALATTARAGLRIGGGVGPAMVVAPLVSTGTMALDELFGNAYYTDIDYVAVGVRSSVSAGGGALAGALAAGAYVSLAGSEAPIVGNVIGFVVGFGGYFLTDWLFGEDVEGSVRMAMGEGGCPRPPRPTPTEINQPFSPMYCFAAGTLVRTGDGGTVPIERVRPGDKVLALDERDGSLQIEDVLGTSVHGLSLILEVVIDGLPAPLRVTSGHMVYTGAAWLPAGALTPGANVAVVNREVLELREILDVRDGGQAIVHDLSVSGCHTYLADNVVVHNKI